MSDVSKTNAELVAQLRNLASEIPALHDEGLLMEVVARTVAMNSVAAIERVRVLHPNVGGECHTCSNESGPTPWPCPTIAALDGAPEPEWVGCECEHPTEHAHLQAAYDSVTSEYDQYRVDRRADIQRLNAELNAALGASAGVAPPAPRTDHASLIARLTGSVNPLSVTCGECGSKPGKRCYGNGEMYRPHPSRASKAERELMIEAADALAAPVQPSSTVDEGKFAEVMRLHSCEYGACACGWRPTIGDDDLAKHQSRAVAEWLRGESR